MLSKYFKMDPIPWLTDGENPAVTYLVKNEISAPADSDKNYDELLKSDLTDYFKKHFSKGILGDLKHLDLFYRGSIWFFLMAVESGYSKDTDIISSTADILCDKTQIASGGFKFNYNVSEAVGCRTGNMISSLLKCGIDDHRVSEGISWIIKHQRKDGGWLHCPFTGFCDVMKLVFFNKTGSGLRYESDDKITSCPVASYACLKALIESNKAICKNSITNGAVFFIKNNFFVKADKNISCGNNVNFNKIGYPVMSQYDYLSGLITISKADIVNNQVNGELFNNIIKKQNNDGSWNCENSLPGMIKEKSFKSRWVTLNALRLINAIVKREDQLENA